MNEMPSSTKRIFPFSLRYTDKEYHYAIGKKVQLSTSNAFYSIAKVISVAQGLMMVAYTKLRRGEPKIIINNIPLHQIKSCRLYE